MFTGRLLFRKFNILHLETFPDEAPLIFHIGVVLDKGRYKIGETVHMTDLSYFAKNNKGLPLILLISGKLVINKKKDDPAVPVERILSDQSFISTVSSGSILITRRERILPVVENLTGIAIIYTGCISRATDIDHRLIEGIVRELSTGPYRFRNLLKPDITNSILLTTSVKRLRLPVLAVIFFCLLVQSFAMGKLNDKNSRLRSEISASRSSRDMNREKSDRNAAIVNEYTPRMPFSFSLVFDAIGSAVPETVVLKQVFIQPLAKNPENNVAVNFHSGKVIIKGLADSSRSAREYVAELQLKFTGRYVMLRSVESSPADSNFSFTIEIDL